MGITNTEINSQSLQKYEAVLEFINLIKDVVGKNATAPDNIKKDIESLKTLLAEHQKILDENNATYAQHQISYSAFKKEKVVHEKDVAEFNSSKEITSSDLLKREKEVRSKEIAATNTAKQHDAISASLVKRESDVSRRESIVSDKEIVNKNAERSNAEFKSKLDARYAALTAPVV